MKINNNVLESRYQREYMFVMGLISLNHLDDAKNFINKLKVNKLRIELEKMYLNKKNELLNKFTPKNKEKEEIKDYNFKSIACDMFHNKIFESTDAYALSIQNNFYNKTIYEQIDDVVRKLEKKDAKKIEKLFKKNIKNTTLHQYASICIKIKK